jgi:hypothetical protein
MEKSLSQTNENYIFRLIYFIIIVGFFLYYAGYACGQALWYYNHQK